MWQWILVAAILGFLIALIVGKVKGEQSDYQKLIWRTFKFSVLIAIGLFVVLMITLIIAGPH